ncbi:MAG: hypothetical protein JWR51_3862 [Devosia sp.]|uniref:hypothetical protein n=1 Tax=Devosia sp. TaxID=1871048 RepID=UPI00261BCBBE|nr:hypothetical protein [Devosia sp.]MDB5530759.1 hypothetical protein [Devosia sp.]
MSISKSRQRPEQINVKFAAAERDAIDERRGQFSRAGWLRNAAFVALGRPPERPDRRGVPPADVASVAVLSGDVRRATGATVQLCQALRLAGHTGFHDLAERILADLRAQSIALTTIIERLK